MTCEQAEETPQFLTPAALRARLEAWLSHAGPALAVGLSGGPDSMALCRVLSDLYMEGNFPEIHAITVDHGLRPESAVEAVQVGKWVAGWPGVTHVILTRTPPEGGTKLMENARFDRYRLLEEYCAKHGIFLLLTAHHRDDQAETLLFRLAKGSGLDGLAAMRPVRRLSSGLQLCRPLLDTSKAALIETCKTYGVPFIDDPSNHNEAYARPRMRVLLEGLKAEGLTTDLLVRTVSRLSRAREALDFYTDKAEQDACLKKETGRIVFEYLPFQSLPEEISLRLLQRACRHVRGEEQALSGYGPRMNRLEELAGMLKSGDPVRTTMAGCLFTVNRKNNTLTVEQENGSSP